MRKAIAMGLKEISNKKIFGGWQKVFQHESEECKCTMKFGAFFPPQVSMLFKNVYRKLDVVRTCTPVQYHMH